MRPFPQRVQRDVVAIISGLLLSASFPPINLAPLAFFALIPIFTVLNSGTSLKRAFVDGWLVGVSFFLASTYWLIPFGIVPYLIVSIVEGLCFGLVAMLYVYLSCFCRTFGVPALFVLLEYGRSHWPLGGFAWGHLGESAAGHFGLLGAASWLGTWGMSFIIIMFNVMITSIFCLYMDRVAYRRIMLDHEANHVAAPERTNQPLRVTSTQMVPMPKLMFYDDMAMFPDGPDGSDGAEDPPRLPKCCHLAPDERPWRLSNPAIATSMHRTLMYTGTLAVLLVAGHLFPYTPPSEHNVAIVGIAQAGDVRTTTVAGVSSFGEITNKAYEMQEQAMRGFTNSYVDLVVWPENGVDVELDDPANTNARDALARSIRRINGAPIITGEYMHQDGKLYNMLSAYTLSKDGVLHRGEYTTKAKLVPFGEWYPWREILDPILGLPLYGDFSIGTGPHAVHVNGYVIGGVICYESSYPEMFDQAIADGSEAIIVATNNSSFGPFHMSYQHMLISRFRAVEFGRDVIHASISGESAIIQADGTIVAMSEQYQPAALQGGVYMRTGTTPGSILNHWMIWIALVLLIQSVAKTVWTKRKAGQMVHHDATTIANQDASLAGEDDDDMDRVVASTHPSRPSGPVSVDTTQTDP